MDSFPRVALAQIGAESQRSRAGGLPGIVKLPLKHEIDIVLVVYWEPDWL